MPDTPTTPDAPKANATLEAPKANPTPDTPKANATPDAPKDIIPPDPVLSKLTVADVTDWLETFAGPEGQKRLAEQGSVGFPDIGAEAAELIEILNILLLDDPTDPARRRGEGAKPHDALLPGPQSGRQPFQRVVIEGERGIGSSGGADVGRVIKRVVAEAFTEATFRSSNQANGMSASGWLPYNGMGIGPVSMYAASPAYAPPSAYGQNGASYGVSTAGSPGQISAQQVILQQQIKPAVCAALDTLQRLQPLSQTIDFAELAALRAATAADLNALLEEATRADGPRPPRKQRYLDQLDTHLAALGVIIREDDDEDFDSAEEESRRAILELLSQQIEIIKTLWAAFDALTSRITFSQGVILAQRLLDSTAGATRSWVEEMDAFGFTFEERRVAQIGDRSGALKRALQNDNIVDRIDAVKDYLRDLAILLLGQNVPAQAR